MDSISQAKPNVGTACLEQQKYAAELALVADRLGSDAWKRIDQFESEIEKLPQEAYPLHHIFTHGPDGKVNLYTREIWMPKGSLLTTRIHLSEHPFVISSGVVAVWDDIDGWIVLRAPHTGVTKPGTRRILYVLEDTLWSTFHVTDKTDPDEIVKEVTFTGGKFSELRGAAEIKKEELPA